MNGGDGIYLDRWMRESGLAALLPSLRAVWVGLSSGSLVMAPQIDDVFASWTSPIGGEGLGLVDFKYFRTSTTLTCPRTPWPTRNDGRRTDSAGYAIDDETAISVVERYGEGRLGRTLAAVRTVTRSRTGRS